MTTMATSELAQAQAVELVRKLWSALTEATEELEADRHERLPALTVDALALRRANLSTGERIGLEAVVGRVFR